MSSTSLYGHSTSLSSGMTSQDDWGKESNALDGQQPFKLSCAALLAFHNAILQVPLYPLN